MPIPWTFPYWLSYDCYMYIFSHKYISQNGSFDTNNIQMFLKAEHFYCSYKNIKIHLQNVYECIRHLCGDVFLSCKCWQTSVCANPIFQGSNAKDTCFQTLPWVHFIVNTFIMCRIDFLDHSPWMFRLKSSRNLYAATVCDLCNHTGYFFPFPCRWDLAIGDLQPDHVEVQCKERSLSKRLPLCLPRQVYTHHKQLQTISLSQHDGFHCFPIRRMSSRPKKWTLLTPFP